MQTINADDELRDLPINDIYCDDDFNCRGKLIPFDVVDLAKDIQQNGLICPVIVMPCNDAQKQRSNGKPWFLVAGYRRVFAHKVNQAATVRSLIKKHMTETEALCINLSENLKRKELSILQEAKVVSKLRGLGMTEEQTAVAIGNSRGWVQIRYMLLALPTEVQEEAGKGVINQTQIRKIYSIYTHHGAEKTFEAVKKLKDAKIKGEQVVLTAKTNDQIMQTKKLRSRKEIFELQTMFRNQVGNGIVTKTLGWCAGELTTEEFVETLKIHADGAGMTFEFKRDEAQSLE